MYNVIFEMETADPDDVMTIGFLTSHPEINLKGISIVPGSKEQVSVVKQILSSRLNIDIPIAAFDPNREKPSVSEWHYSALKCDKTRADPDCSPEELYRRIAPDVVITGSPPKAFGSIIEKIPNTISQWTAQGGFAGDNIVPAEYRLGKFNGMITCPTFNFGGAREEAKRLLSTNKILFRRIVSKNVCHGMIYDNDMHAIVKEYHHKSPGLNFIYNAMSEYLSKKHDGKKFHDPLAAASIVNPDIFKWCEVELYEEKGKWGSRKKEGSNTFISIYADREKFIQTLIKTKE